MNKRGSLEIGVNTIVILVIAMMLLGLGIGFVKGLFGQANKLPELIDTDSWENPPTANDPIRLTPTNIELKKGTDKDMKIGVYNTGSEGTFTIMISSCKGPVVDGQPSDKVPQLLAADSLIKSGASQGFKAILTANDNEGLELTKGKYVCTIQATNPEDETNSYSTQFIMTVTA